MSTESNGPTTITSVLCGAMFIVACVVGVIIVMYAFGTPTPDLSQVIGGNTDDNTFPFDTSTVATAVVKEPINNEDRFTLMRIDRTYNGYCSILTQCSDGVVCYSLRNGEGIGSWCTRDCDIVKKYCPMYNGACSCINC